MKGMEGVLLQWEALTTTPVTIVKEGLCAILKFEFRSLHTPPNVRKGPVVAVVFALFNEGCLVLMWLIGQPGTLAEEKRRGLRRVSGRLRRT